MKKLILLLALVVPLIFAPAAGAVHVFSNGNFMEGITNPATYPGSFTTLSAPDTSIPEWAVTGGSVDYIGTYWVSPTGSLSLDMNGNSPGTIQQTFYTTPGQEYLVTFDLAGNFDGGPNPKILAVSVGGTPQDYTFYEPPGWGHGNMGWTEEYFTFLGTGTTTLQFEGINDGPWGPTLADVTLTAIPLPPTVLLLGSGLFGLGILGRRKIFKA